MIILISLFFAHWMGDYTHLSMPSMLAAKKFGKPLLPIFMHAFVHTLLIMSVLLLFSVDPIKIAYCLLIMISTHFGIDVWKGRMNVWFPSLQNPANKFHWWVFGIDQFMHATVLIIIYKIAAS